MARKKNNALPNVGVIYARYSDHRQKDASIEQQVDAATKRAAEDGITITEVYADRALSGKTDKRPNFQRMMRDAEKGRFSYVLAWKSNRMGRNMLQALMTETKLAELGIKVSYVEEDFDDSAAGRFALRSMMNVNQFYSENMAEDIQRGMRDNAANCKITNGQLPYGYTRGPDKTYMLDDTRADVVREIFSRVADGDAFSDIAATLNARGIKTGRGQDWGKSSFQAILKNERYTGVYIYDDIRVDGGIPQIITPDLYWRVQEVLKMKKNPQGRGRRMAAYLLTGKLYCGSCERPMVGVSGTGRGGVLHHYYSCNGSRVDKTCDRNPVSRDWLEYEVAAAIKTHIMRPDVIAVIADMAMGFSAKTIEDSTLGILSDDLAENQKGIKNIMTAIEQGIITPTTKDRLEALEAEQAQIKIKISLARADVVDIKREDVLSWLKTFEDGDPKDKRYQASLFDSFLVAVYLHDDKMHIGFNFTGGPKRITIPLEAINRLESGVSGDMEGGSYKVCAGPPKRTNPNHPIFVGDVFGFVV